MVDIQRRAVLRSLAKGADASSGARSPHMYQAKTDGMDMDADAAVFFASPSPAASSASSSSAASSMASPYNPTGFHQSALFASMGGDDDDNLFAAYAAEPQQQELDEALRSNAWDLYYPTGMPASMLPAATGSSSGTNDLMASVSLPTLSISTGRGAVARATTATSTVSTTRVRQGVKRPLANISAPLPSPPTLSVSVASSMLAMRNNAEPAIKTSAAARVTAGRTVSARSRGKKAEDVVGVVGADAVSSSSSSSAEAEAEPPTKKVKVSRERQLKINAASRRCRKKQKLELQFLRTHVVDLQVALKEQVSLLRSSTGQQQQCAQLAAFLEESIHQVEDMSAGGRPGTPKPALFTEAELQQLKADANAAPPPPTETNTNTSAPTPTVGCSVKALDPMTGYSLSEERTKTLLNIAAFMRNNISLESQSFSPEVISCLPIEMDGWQLRLAITEKNYTIHNCKFFPCKVEDLFDFCWATNVESKLSIKQGKNDYCVVTPLDQDVAHVYTKTIGKWSLSVHGVANVSYNSLVCRTYNADTRRAMICQQSVLEDRDFEDESTIPWLFKRWVVFQPRVVDGVDGTFVEAYRTASYATGRLIYKEDNTYDSFCEHLIRRYAESNALLERMMARDPRFQQMNHAHRDDDVAFLLQDQHEETTSDRMVKDLLLF